MPPRSRNTSAKRKQQASAHEEQSSSSDDSDDSDSEMEWVLQKPVGLGGQGKQGSGKGSGASSSGGKAPKKYAEASLGDVTLRVGDAVYMLNDRPKQKDYVVIVNHFLEIDGEPGANVQWFTRKSALTKNAKDAIDAINETEKCKMPNKTDARVQELVLEHGTVNDQELSCVVGKCASFVVGEASTSYADLVARAAAAAKKDTDKTAEFFFAYRAIRMQKKDVSFTNVGKLSGSSVPKAPPAQGGGTSTSAAAASKGKKAETSGATKTATTTTTTTTMKPKGIDATTQEKEKGKGKATTMSKPPPSPARKKRSLDVAASNEEKDTEPPSKRPNKSAGVEEKKIEQKDEKKKVPEQEPTPSAKGAAAKGKPQEHKEQQKGGETVQAQKASNANHQSSSSYITAWLGMVSQIPG